MWFVDFEIRELRRHELPGLLRLYQDLHPNDEAPLTDDAVEGVWSGLCDRDDFFFIGVLAGEELVATCSLAIIPNLTRGCRPYGVIENVVTLEAYRRRGLGRAVLRHALEVAWKRDCYKVMLLTSRLNEETFRFYESGGFDRHAKQAFVARPRA